MIKLEQGFIEETQLYFIIEMVITIPAEPKTSTCPCIALVPKLKLNHLYVNRQLIMSWFLVEAPPIDVTLNCTFDITEIHHPCHGELDH